MRYTTANRGFPAGNPIANALVIIIGTLAIAASIVVGFLAFILFGSALLILAAIVGIRLWWLRRKTGNVRGSARPGRSSDGHGRQTIEGEYDVVIDERDDTGP